MSKVTTELGFETIEDSIAVSIKLGHIIFAAHFKVVIWNTIFRVGAKLCPEIGCSVGYVNGLASMLTSPTWVRIFIDGDTGIATVDNEGNSTNA